MELIRMELPAPRWFRWGVYKLLAILALVFNTDSNAGFIYFQF